MLTEFGKELRRLRLEEGILLKDMAEAANISSSYLSAIETGKRDIPDDLIKKITKHYKLSKDQQVKLEDKALMSKNEAMLKHNPLDDGECIAALARGFDKLNAEQLDAIKTILGGEEKENE